MIENVDLDTILLFCRVYSSFSILTFVYHVTLFVNKQAQIHSRPIFMRQRQTPTIVDKDAQLNNLLFVFLKRYIYTNKSVFKEYNFCIKKR